MPAAGRFYFISLFTLTAKEKKKKRRKERKNRGSRQISGEERSVVSFLSDDESAFHGTMDEAREGE